MSDVRGMSKAPPMLERNVEGKSDLSHVAQTSFLFNEPCWVLHFQARMVFDAEVSKQVVRQYVLQADLNGSKQATNLLEGDDVARADLVVCFASCA